MSKVRQSITPRTVTAPPKPVEREVVINVNKNVLFALTLAFGALVMLGGGFAVGQLLFRPHNTAATTSTTANAVAPAAQGGSSAPAINNPSGLPSALQGAGVAGAPSGVQVKPANPDPNALHPNLEGYAPISVAALPVAPGAPRIQIIGIDEKATLDMGEITPGEKREYNFEMKNVGSVDLVVNQMYTSCGCTLATFAGRIVTDDPFDPSVIIKPGQSVPLNISYDSAALEDKGHVDKFVQIFSNDPTGKDIQQPFRETRFRLTGQVGPDEQQ